MTDIPVTTYTVYSDATMAVEGRGLSVADAADIILRHDGGRYEVRREPRRHDVDGDSAYQLYVPPAGGTGEWLPAYTGDALCRVYAADQTAAWQEIAAMVITADWPRRLACMPDDEYDAMLAEIAAP